LEYARDEDVEAIIDNAFEKEKNKVRKILLGSCKMNDPKMEKNGTYEITPPVCLLIQLIYVIERGQVL
jgi:hypothetical protein